MKSIPFIEYESIYMSSDYISLYNGFVTFREIDLDQRWAMSIQRGEQNAIVLITSVTYMSSYLFEYNGTSSTNIQNLKSSSYSCLTTLKILSSISALHNSTYTFESQNKYESREDTKILTRRWKYVFAFWCQHCTHAYSLQPVLINHCCSEYENEW